MYALRTACLLLFVWLSYQLPYIAQPDSPQSTQQSKRKENDTAKKRTASEGQNTQQYSDPQNPKPEDIAEKRLYHKYLRATIIGVGISLFFFGALIWQNILTRRAVNAAHISADALIASERAWIMVEAQPAPGFSGPYKVETIAEDITGEIVVESTGIAIRITCTNAGRTPAWISEKFAYLDIVDSIPPNPDFTFAEIAQVEPESMTAGERKTTEIGLIRRKGHTIGSMPIVYGIVKYRDIFSRDRYTTFGYRIRVDHTFVRLADPAYNEND